MINRCTTFLLAACLPLVSVHAQASEPDRGSSGQAAKIPFVKVDAEAAVRNLAAAVEERFVFPEAGKKYSVMLHANLAAGKYASFADAEEFAQTVTADLQAVHKDGHLRLRPMRPEFNGKPVGRARPEGSAVARSGWLAEGVAYIDFRGFPGNEATIKDVRAFLAAHRDARALIIDARRNGGGGLAEMNEIFGEIFAKPTTLVVMDIRLAVEQKHGTPFREDATLREVPGPKTIVRREHFVTPAAAQGPLKDARVYVLTSKETFSAAEHLSLSLKRTRRATLVGQATGGGAHFGGVVPLGGGYGAFIPVGRTFDPDTGESWEGTGVKPDVEVPADKALEEALKLAGVDPIAAAANADR